MWKGPLSDDAERLKRAAAERAVEHVESGMVLGLGTGSTARHVVDVLAERLEAGELRDVVGIATSESTRAHARARGVPLTELEEGTVCDLTIDGADEIGPRLDLIKGLGGALLWEKMVASASERLIIVADESKLVDRLGTRAPLPVEVVPFGWRVHLPFLRELGAAPSLREREGRPVRTDGGHYLLDLAFEDGIADAAQLDERLNERVGVVEHGLFLGMATAAVVAGAAGVRVLER